jgi:hypothetical protein
MGRAALLTFSFLAVLLGPTGTAAATVEDCQGYSATNVNAAGSTLTADLQLRGQGCGVYGPDIKKLALRVVYETGTPSNVLHCCRST